jgi:ectoine hydroxylase-related dioxygenase (phytanoyl-CoA dioxygenase family)
VLLDATAHAGDAMRAASFTTDAARALAAYVRSGYQIEPGLLTAAECTTLLDAAKRLDAGAEPRTPVMNPHRADPVFLDALRHPAIVVILERLLGGPVSGIQSQYFPCVPGTPGFTAHQDNHYVEAARDAFASAWIALDDTSAENGALIAYPGSHREPLLPVEDVPEATPHPTQAFNAIRQRVLVPQRYAPTTLCVPRGAVVFLHGHLLHASHENQATRPRRALLATYVRQGTPFRRGETARRTEIDLYETRRAS